ncbi:hypothetical protein JCM9157_647 [Halalkalibacter akibai JCM 9157]|uniref:Uncharacterized protein n=1 Tax=Halalkalibacter akibai (strain ATCC 43226 / DSM 21942 / CIP 109018 / JCM 9157 / 1139) TaxID=1236973 RepID=W4QQK9_HALA3|nr:hypothetical protein JCM9157_647 [Halalkalibacter akibai JCM 9157]
MNLPIETIQEQLQQLLNDLQKAYPFSKETLLVVGTSTSEVVGEHIGSNGSHEIAKVIFNVLEEVQLKTGVRLAFQCCEHLTER